MGNTGVGCFCCCHVIPEEEVHDSRGVDMSEEELDKARLGLDVVDDLEAGELVGVPILPCTHRGGRERNNPSSKPLDKHSTPHDRH